MTVNVEAMRAWVAALRSGEYQQGTGRLTTKTYDKERDTIVTKHCCLGVACVLAKEQGLPLAVHVDSLDLTVYTDENGSSSTTIWPTAVTDFYTPAALPSDRMRGVLKVQIPPSLATRPLLVGAWAGELAWLNDSAGFTFNEIADCIEYTFLRSDWDATHPVEPPDAQLAG